MQKHKCKYCDMEGIYKSSTNRENTYYCPHHKTNDSIRISENDSQNYKVEELFPLLLAVSVVTLLSFARQIQNIDWMLYMMDFMGLFLLCFGLLKLLDLKGYAQTFATYDLIAKRFTVYGYLFPFIEIVLGFMYLSGFMFFWQNVFVLILSLLGMYSAYEVIKNKHNVRCVCLGTYLHIPMTWTTFTENFLMALMAVLMLMFPMSM